MSALLQHQATLQTPPHSPEISDSLHTAGNNVLNSKFETQCMYKKRENKVLMEGPGCAVCVHVRRGAVAHRLWRSPRFRRPARRWRRRTRGSLSLPLSLSLSRRCSVSRELGDLTERDAGPGKKVRRSKRAYVRARAYP